MSIGTDSWFLEMWAPQGLKKEDIRTSPTTTSTPSEFREEVDKDYYHQLVSNAEEISKKSRDPFIEVGGEMREVRVKGNRLEYTETGENITVEDWNERPTLFARSPEAEDEKVFWDGDTFIARPEIDDDILTLQTFDGSYAERLAAQDKVGEYPVEDLPLSMNITIVPLFKHGGEQVFPVFYRNNGVAEYPNYFHTVAGGIPGTHMHPVDGGWREMVEEIRVGPDWVPEEYADNGVLDEEITEGMREGNVEGNRIYTFISDKGQRNLYRTDSEMQVLGIARNLETHTPELCAIVETDIPYEVVEENYTRGAEHAYAQPLSIDREAVKEFSEEHDNIIPVGEAAFYLAADYYGKEGVIGEDIGETNLPSAYQGFDTRVIG